MATRRSSKRRAPRNPRDMSPEDLGRLRIDSERRLELMEAFFVGEEWKILAQFFDGRLRGLENLGRGLRRKLMRPIAGEPPVTLEQIAANQARIDETSVARRLDKTIIASWRSQIEQLDTIRAGSPI